MKLSHSFIVGASDMKEVPDQYAAVGTISGKTLRMSLNPINRPGAVPHYLNPAETVRG